MVKGNDPDAELMQAAARGDLNAFGRLVEKYQEPVINFIYRTLPDTEEAEDLAQNVFLQALKAAPRYKSSAKFTTWLFTIARNLTLNEIRRRSRRPSERLESPEWSDPLGPPLQREDRRAEPPGEVMLKVELEEKVQEALRELPEAQRTAVTLFQQDEMSYEDIADVLGISLSATKSLIHRARETLRGRLKPYLKSGVWKVE